MKDEKPPVPDLISTAEAARRLGVSHEGGLIVRFINRAKNPLPAIRLGRDWWIRPADLEAFAKIPRKSGRPAKNGKIQDAIA